MGHSARRQPIASKLVKPNPSIERSATGKPVSDANYFRDHSFNA
jgi:hypothetical protein